MTAEPLEAPRTTPAVSIPPQNSKARFFIIALILLVVALMGTLFIWAERQRRSAMKQLETTETELEQLKNTAGTTTEEQATHVIDRVRALIKIPAEPAPTVATINDIERLRKSNEFFNSAENGDFLILTEDRAILYDPEQNIVIDVAPFRVNVTPATPTPSGVERSVQQREE